MVALTFYQDDYVLVDHGNSESLGNFRANFVRDSDSQVAWLSYGGRLYARQ